MEENPTFNLKAVVLETGLKPDTLRAWERRYGLPQPQRTPGGHRLYSQRDIDMLKWLTERQEEGLSISRAVALWHQLEADGKDPLYEVENEAPAEIAEPVSSPALGGTLAQTRQAWIDACLAFDEQRADAVLAQAFSLYPQEMVCLEILQRGLATIGEGWYRGKTTVQQEHFASSLAMRRLNTLIASMPPPTRDKRVLIGCPPEDDHVFIPLLLTLLLRRRGWDVIYLGANVPVMRLEGTIDSTRSDLVVMSAQQLHTAANLLAVGEFMVQREIPMAFGGTVFNFIPGLAERIPGHFLGKTLPDAIPLLEKLLHEPKPVPAAEPAPEIYQTTLRYYRDHQALLEAHVWENLGHGSIAQAHLSIANMKMARSIIAALTLGDMEFLGPNISWVEGLLENYHLPTLQLHQYLDAYFKAARSQLGTQGELITTWLGRIINA